MTGCDATARYEALVSRVLIVDDEADVRFVVRNAFEGAGHEVIEAVHGADAVAKIGEAKPDLVITEQHHDAGDGRSAVDRVVAGARGDVGHPDPGDDCVRCRRCRR
jgi:CheY-like chemotaxis protein